ncbi:hypothetical protein BGX28_005250 [Mortierella sp. GBA30]|nr:hypothetical protein BGX28_005250 [Mortierella sp. GBA30]
MHYGQNFISFHDLTPAGRFLWASASIEDCLGYTPDDVLNTSPYDIVINEDVSPARTAHAENVLNDMVASQAILRYRHKDGTQVMALVVYSICYEFMVSCVTMLESDGRPFTNAHCAAMTRIVQSKKEEFARIKRHHEAFKANTWDPNGLEPEPRVCMVLNRYTRGLGVMYASPLCEYVLQVDAEKIVGKPFLLFIRADDLASFVELVDLAKSSDTITHMRFWFQSPGSPQEIPCEAALIGASDGMVLIIRRCKRFVRRRRILDMEHYERFCTRHSSVDSTNFSVSPSTSTSCSSPSFTQSDLANGDYWERERTAERTLQWRVSMGSINRIIELDSDDDLKPLATIESEIEPCSAEGLTSQRERSFRRHHVQEGDDDGTEEVGEA